MYTSKKTTNATAAFVSLVGLLADVMALNAA
jgi:hypothetical protein